MMTEKNGASGGHWAWKKLKLMTISTINVLEKLV